MRLFNEIIGQSTRLIGTQYAVEKCFWALSNNTVFACKPAFACKTDLLFNTVPTGVVELSYESRFNTHRAIYAAYRPLVWEVSCAPDVAGLFCRPT